MLAHVADCQSAQQKEKRTLWYNCLATCIGTKKITETFEQITECNIWNVNLVIYAHWILQFVQQLTEIVQYSILSFVFLYPLFKFPIRRRPIDRDHSSRQRRKFKRIRITCMRMRNLCKDYLRAFGSSRIGAIHTIQYVLSTGDDELPSVNSFNREQVFYTFTQTSQQDSTILLFGKILYFFFFFFFFSL